MSKKDFIALAYALRLSKPVGIGFEPQTYLAVRAQWEADRMRIADVLARSNPRFNRTRWFNYIDDKCGPSGGKIKS